MNFYKKTCWSGPYEGFTTLTFDLKPGVNYKINGSVTNSQVSNWLEDSQGSRVSDVATDQFVAISSQHMMDVMNAGHEFTNL